MTMLKTEFDPEMGDWFEEFKLWLDLGYHGAQNHYVIRELEIPHKRERRENKKDPKIELTAGQKAYNKSVSSKRIRVEHAIGGLKRYRILSDRLRNRDAKFYSIILGVCAALWNYTISR